LLPRAHVRTNNQLSLSRHAMLDLGQFLFHRFSDFFQGAPLATGEACTC